MTIIIYYYYHRRRGLTTAATADVAGSGQLATSQSALVYRVYVKYRRGRVSISQVGPTTEHDYEHILCFLHTTIVSERAYILLYYNIINMSCVAIVIPMHTIERTTRRHIIIINTNFVD